jgi:hypothetical protein
MTRAFLGHLGYDAEQIERRVEGELKELCHGSIGMTTRRVMETLGTDWGRQMVREDLWTMIMSKKIERLMHQGHSVLVEDVRFPNEYGLLSRFQATLVKVIRPGARGGTKGYEGQLDHFDFDHVIDNTGTLDELRSKALSLVQEVQQC